MINPDCKKCGVRPLLESEAAAFAAGWLKITHGGKDLWLCPAHVSAAGEVLESEGAIKVLRHIQEA